MFTPDEGGSSAALCRVFSVVQGKVMPVEVSGRNFLVIKGFVFRAVLNHAPGSLDHVIPQVTVTGFVHGSIFCPQLPGLVLLPDNAPVFGKGVVVLNALDGVKFSKYPTGTDRADAGYRGQADCL